MELYKLLGFMAILRESLKNFLKRGKLMASITFLSLSLHSLLLLANTFSIKPSLNDLITNATFLQFTTPGTSEFAKLVTAVLQNLQVFAVLEWIFIVTTYATYLFCAATIILASGVTHRGIDISIKVLLLRVVKSWKRPFITGFYIILFELGYYGFITWATLIPLVLIFPGHITLSATIIFILASVFLSYLAVAWNLAIVVSVLEERCGIDALGRAAELVKGLKLSGFFLNIVFRILSLAVILGFRLLNNKQSITRRQSIVLLLANCLWLIDTFALMALTVFYYECKKNQGEKEIDSFEYTKIPTAEHDIVQI